MSDAALQPSPLTDLLDFEGQALYFDEVMDEQVATLLDKASMGKTASERVAALDEADRLAPDDLNVIVALYRFYYFQHDFDKARFLADRAMQTAGRRLNIPGDWRALQPDDIARAGSDNMTLLRFYLWALKGEGYLLMRLGRFDQAVPVLEKLSALDRANRLNGNPLLALAHEQLSKQKLVEDEKRRTVK